MKLNKEEKDLLNSVEENEWQTINNFKKRKLELEKIAHNTLKKDKRINIRISERDLVKLKEKAFEEGLPYQTYIASILHKFVRGRYTDSGLM